MRIFTVAILAGLLSACSADWQLEYRALGQAVASVAEFENGVPLLVGDSVVFRSDSRCRAAPIPGGCARIETGLVEGFAEALGIDAERVERVWTVCPGYPGEGPRGSVAQLVLQGEFEDSAVVHVRTLCRSPSGGHEVVRYYRALRRSGGTWSIVEHGFSSSGVTG